MRDSTRAGLVQPHRVHEQHLVTILPNIVSCKKIIAKMMTDAESQNC